MMGNGMMNGSNMMMGWGGMFFGPLMMIGILALAIFAIVMMVKWMNDGGSGHHSSNNSLNMLKERLAPVKSMKPNTKSQLQGRSQ